MSKDVKARDEWVKHFCKWPRSGYKMLPCQRKTDLHSDRPLQKDVADGRVACLRPVPWLRHVQPCSSFGVRPSGRAVSLLQLLLSLLSRAMAASCAAMLLPWPWEQPVLSSRFSGAVVVVVVVVVVPFVRSTAFRRAVAAAKC
jgi:hypothetical protein